MLEFLRLQEVGPAPETELALAPRLNLITGDNGLGKSFLLDVAWWAMTRTWARQPALPRPGATAPSIVCRYTKAKASSSRAESSFDRKRQLWPVTGGGPAIAGLVLYAQVDGGFSVWDPAKNYYLKKETPDRPTAFSFTASEVWDGNALCEGLIRDWASWQREDGPAFAELQRVLKALSPDEDEPLVPGELVKISVDDPKRYPTLAMPYGQDVPITHASAGMRRIIALAYLLVWAWHEHLAAAKLLGDAPSSEVIFLIDEIEAHLHPRWQLKIVPALLAVMDTLTGQHGSRVQLIAVTHSPLVLASAEPDFDPEKDAWFDMDLEPATAGPKVVVRKREFSRLGTAGRWLTSEAFGLHSEGRAPQIEALLEEASLALGEEKLTPAAARKLDQRLRSVLGDTDPFWTRWRFIGEQRGWLAPATSTPRSAATRSAATRSAAPRSSAARKVPRRR